MKETELNHSLKLIAKSSMIVFIGVILSKIFNYLYRIIIARYYGPEVYGLFSLSFIITSFLVAFASLGLGQGLLRYVSIFRGKDESRKIEYLFESSIFYVFFISVFTGLILFLLRDIIAQNLFNNADLSIFLLFFSVAIPFLAVKSLYVSVVRAFERIGWFSFLSNIFNNFAKVLVLGILIFIGGSFLSVPLSYLIGSILMLSACFLVWKLVIQKKKENRDKEDLLKSEKKKLKKDLFSYSWPLIFFSAIAFLLNWTDSFMIGLFKTVQDVGFYNAAVPIAFLIVFSRDLLAQLFFPLVTKEYYKGNKKLVKELSQQVGKWILILSLPVFCLLILFPGAFINILFGKEYLVAMTSLRFLAIGFLFASIFGISKDLLSMKGKSKLILLDLFIVFFINILLNISLIPKYGINGAAFSTMVSLVLLNVIYVFQTKKYLSIISLKLKGTLRIFISLFISLAILLVLRLFIQINILTLILMVILFEVIYLALIFYTKSLDENDLHILELIKKKIFGR